MSLLHKEKNYNKENLFISLAIEGLPEAMGFDHERSDAAFIFLAVFLVYAPVDKDLLCIGLTVPTITGMCQVLLDKISSFLPCYCYSPAAHVFVFGHP